jgi:two-component system response regulator RegA
MKTMLLADDDMVFCEVLAQMLAERGFEVKVAHHVEEAVETARAFQPEYALVDLKIPGGSGLTLIPKLLLIDPYTRIVVLTGFATIATAVEAIKLGALHYLAKPVNADDIIDAFNKQEGNPYLPIEEETSRTLHSISQDYIRTALKRNNYNISATARELGMHRRTLQRKLEKR